MMYYFMSRYHKDIINHVTFAFKMSLLSKRHFINMRKPYFIFKTYVMSWLWRCHVSLMHTPSSKVLPKLLSVLSWLLGSISSLRVQYHFRVPIRVLYLSDNTDADGWRFNMLNLTKSRWHLCRWYGTHHKTKLTDAQRWPNIGWLPTISLVFQDL